VKRIVLGTGALSLYAEDNRGSRDALVGVWIGKYGDKKNPRRRKTLEKARKVYYAGYKKVRLVIEVLDSRRRPTKKKKNGEGR
jgi:hypothetical protein